MAPGLRTGTLGGQLSCRLECSSKRIDTQGLDVTSPRTRMRTPLSRTRNGTDTMPAGNQIQKYFVDFADKHGLWKYMCLETQVIQATWLDGEGECSYSRGPSRSIPRKTKRDPGELDLRRKDGSRYKDRCHVLINGSGPLNRWKCWAPSRVQWRWLTLQGPTSRVFALTGALWCIRQTGTPQSTGGANESP